MEVTGVLAAAAPLRGDLQEAETSRFGSSEHLKSLRCPVRVFRWEFISSLDITGAYVVH